MNMKTVLIALVLVALMVSPAAADALRTTSGVKVDAPNLIQITNNLSIGAEVSKDVVYDIFRDRAYVEDDKGIVAYVKLTWTGSLIDFRK